MIFNNQRKKDEDFFRRNHLDTQSISGEDNITRGTPGIAEHHVDTLRGSKQESKK